MEPRGVPLQKQNKKMEPRCHSTVVELAEHPSHPRADALRHRASGDRTPALAIWGPMNVIDAGTDPPAGHILVYIFDVLVRGKGR